MNRIELNKELAELEGVLQFKGPYMSARERETLYGHIDNIRYQLEELNRDCDEEHSIEDEEFMLMLF